MILGDMGAAIDVESWRRGKESERDDVGEMDGVFAM